MATHGDALDRFIRGVRRISALCGYVAAGLIAIAVVVVCQMVFVRYVLNQTTIWQTDFTIYSLVAATFIGCPFVLVTRGHVNVDVLPHYSGPRLRFWLAVFANAVTLVFAVTMAAVTFHLFKEAWDQRWVSDTMWRARMWIPYSSMPIGMSLLALESLAGLAALLTGREAPFGIEDAPR